MNSSPAMSIPCLSGSRPSILNIDLDLSRLRENPTCDLSVPSRMASIYAYADQQPRPPIFLAKIPLFTILPAEFLAGPQCWRELIGSAAAESTRREPTENLSADEILFAPLALRRKISQSFISASLIRVENT